MSDDERENMISDMLLPDGVLNVNTGFPIVILLTKSDVMNFGEGQEYYRQHFEFILSKVRHFALSLGASVFSVSGLRNINLEQLYAYICY